MWKKEEEECKNENENEKDSLKRIRHNESGKKTANYML